MLTACATSSDVLPPQLPATTQDLNQCTDEAVPAIPGKAGEPLLKGVTAGVIGDQRAAAVAKDKCAHDWRSFYEDLRTKLGGKSGG